MTLNIFLPQRIVGPEEAAGECVRYANVPRAKVRKEVFVGATRFATDLKGMRSKSETAYTGNGCPQEEQDWAHEVVRHVGQMEQKGHGVYE